MASLHTVFVSSCCKHFVDFHKVSEGDADFGVIALQLKLKGARSHLAQSGFRFLGIPCTLDVYIGDHLSLGELCPRNTSSNVNLHFNFRRTC